MTEGQSAITGVHDEEMERLRAELAEARATIDRVRYALMNQSYLTSLDDTIEAALAGERLTDLLSDAG